MHVLSCSFHTSTYSGSRYSQTTVAAADKRVFPKYTLLANMGAPTHRNNRTRVARSSRLKAPVIDGGRKWFHFPQLADNQSQRYVRKSVQNLHTLTVRSGLHHTPYRGRCFIGNGAVPSYIRASVQSGYVSRGSQPTNIFFSRTP